MYPATESGRSESNPFDIDDYLLSLFLSEEYQWMIIGTLRNHDVAIGRRLLLRHLITTSCEKESLYLIPT